MLLSAARPPADKDSTEPTFVNDSTATVGGLSISVHSARNKNDTLTVTYALEWTRLRPGLAFWGPWTHLTIEYFDADDMLLGERDEMIFMSQEFARGQSRSYQGDVAFSVPIDAWSFAVGFKGTVSTRKVRVPHDPRSRTLLVLSLCEDGK